MGTLLETKPPHGAATDDWPAQVELVLSALETGQHRQADRRTLPRRPYRVRAKLRLFTDFPGAAPWLIYTRNANSKGLGFITTHRLPLGYGGMIEVPLSGRGVMRAHCTLHRCRPAAPGWYEGALSFNREQHELA